MRTPGTARSPRPTRTGRRTLEREPEAAVEEDHRDAEREEDLHGDGVGGQVDRIGDLGPEQRADHEEHDHPRHAQEAGDELGAETGGEEDRQRLDHVARGHRVDSARRRGRLRGRRAVGSRWSRAPRRLLAAGLSAAHVLPDARDRALPDRHRAARVRAPAAFHLVGVVALARLPAPTSSATSSSVATSPTDAAPKPEPEPRPRSRSGTAPLGRIAMLLAVFAPRVHRAQDLCVARGQRQLPGGRGDRETTRSISTPTRSSSAASSADSTRSCSGLSPSRRRTPPASERSVRPSSSTRGPARRKPSRASGPYVSFRTLIAGKGGLLAPGPRPTCFVR